MKSKLLASLVASTLVTLSARAEAPAAPTAPAAAPAAAAAPQASKFSEAQVLEVLGWYIGKSSGLSDFELTGEQLEVIIRGMRLAHAGKDAPSELQAIGPDVDKFIKERRTVAMARMAAKAKEEGGKALAEAAARPGAQKTASGVIFEILKPGEGAFPKATDTVSVQYIGKLPDGSTFDSSYESGQPVEFPLSGVIPGWTEGIQKINKGGKIRLTIPSDLAYGSEPRQGIPANSVLIFEVELVDIKAPAAEPAAPVPAQAVAPEPAK
ncbi:FKBP-type peptidyl-prolyl cis-trans isomerase [Nibricoccus sp. IMCC34717]|uniref:FKBP-type peptidyl-prolyl cis-trans isomerase n=1 Tax=Nibricoccus sp. IMCC34717 TaxID=3034021 RepID=UPI00384F04A1